MHVKLYNNIVECEIHVFFHCPKCGEIRNVFLFNWYTSDTNITNLYSLIHNDNPDVIKM